MRWILWILGFYILIFHATLRGTTFSRSTSSSFLNVPSADPESLETFIEISDDEDCVEDFPCEVDVRYAIEAKEKDISLVIYCNKEGKIISIWPKLNPNSQAIHHKTNFPNLVFPQEEDIEFDQGIVRKTIGSYLHICLNIQKAIDTCDSKKIMRLFANGNVVEFLCKSPLMVKFFCQQAMGDDERKINSRNIERQERQNTEKFFKLFKNLLYKHRIALIETPTFNNDYSYRIHLMKSVLVHAKCP